MPKHTDQLPLFDSTQAHEPLSVNERAAIRTYQDTRQRSAAECIRRVARDLQTTNAALVGLPFVSVGTIAYSVKARKRRGLYWCYVEGTQEAERTAHTLVTTRDLPAGAIKPLHPITDAYKVAAHGVALAHLPALWHYGLEDYSRSVENANT